MTRRSERLCPRCRLGLYVGQTASVCMYACGKCGGIWLDQTDANRMVHSLCDHALQLADQATQHAPEKVNTDAEGVPCPVCLGAMTRTRVAAAWLDVDICAHHGTWFDKGELQKVARALKQPNAGDWRRAPATPVHQRAMGSAAATAGAVGAVGAAGIAAGVAEGLTDIAEAHPVATEVAADLAVEGTFTVLGFILEAIFD